MNRDRTKTEKTEEEEMRREGDGKWGLGGSRGREKAKK